MWHLKNSPSYHNLLAASSHVSGDSVSGFSIDRIESPPNKIKVVETNL